MPGADFDRQIVVKINIAEVLRRELARPRWTREHVAMGTNTDPYQRAEGRYRLMPPVITALAGSRTPFSILTKGTLLSRDLPLLSEAADPGEGRRLHLAGPARRGAARHPGARYADAAGPARADPADPGGRPALRRTGRADPALPDRLRRAPRGPGATSSPPPGRPASAASRSTCGPGPGSGSSPGCAGPTPSWSTATTQLYARGAYVPKAYADDLQRRLAPIQGRRPGRPTSSVPRRT